MSSYIVIGEDGGVGGAISRRLQEDGHTVLGSEQSRVDVTRTDVLADYIFQAGNGAGPGLAGLVYAVGINRLEWYGDMGMSGVLQAERMYHVNCLGFIAALDAFARFTGRGAGNHARGTRSVLASSAPLGRLSVLAISSDAGEREMRTSAGYCASKAALNMAVRVGARELGPHGVAVNALSPGMIEGTSMTIEVEGQVTSLRGWSHDEMMKYEQSQEVVPGRIPVADVADAAAGILYMPFHLNGEIITMDGGR